MTGAPRVLDGKIIVGISGGDVGIRGFVDAYDAKTGQRLWRVSPSHTRASLVRKRGEKTWPALAAPVHGAPAPMIRI